MLKFTANEAPLLVLCWPTMKARILCRKLRFLRKIGTKESTLFASILHSLTTEDILNVSLVQQCLKLGTYLGTNFTMPICEVILKSPEAESIPNLTKELLKKDFNYILTRAHTHPSLKYAINDAIQDSVLKLLDTTLDYGAGGTRHTLATLLALTTPLFGDRICSAPWCPYPVINNTNTFLDHVMKHHWTNAHPPTPETLIGQVTNNPGRALQIMQLNLHLYICTHIHSNSWIKLET